MNTQAGSGSAVSKEEFVRRAGVSPERLETLMALGLVATATREPDSMAFIDADVERVRLVEALSASGVSLDKLAAAVRAGQVPLAAISRVSPRAIEISERSIAEIAHELGISLDLVAYVYAMWGLSAPEPDEPLRADDEALWQIFATIYRGRIDPQPFVACNRIFAEGIRKVVDGIDEHLRRDLEASDGSAGDRLIAVGQEARRVAPLVAGIAEWGLNRFLEHALTDYFVALAEQVVDGDVDRPAPEAATSSIAFLDLTGFTALAEERGDAVAAEKAAALGQIVQETAQRFRGRLVKLLGDGAMLSFAKPVDAVRGGLQLVARVRSLDLPPARVGIASGAVVRKDGDLFGRTVNKAARIADYARPMEVLVDESVAEEAGRAGIQFTKVGPVELKGVPGLVTVLAARP
jgi:adenylate cyclase